MARVWLAFSHCKLRFCASQGVAGRKPTDPERLSAKLQRCRPCVSSRIMNAVECACSCGTTRFQTAAEPLFRILCHCTICQRFNEAPLADVLVYRAEDVTLPSAGVVEFDTYRPPPNVQRGKCAACGQPAVEVFAAPILPRLVMIPRPMLPLNANIQPPRAHIFYDKRVTDAHDALPRYEGYVRSQLTFLKYLWSARNP